MFKTYRFRIYPNQNQIDELDSVFCGMRHFYNHLVENHLAGAQSGPISFSGIPELISQVIQDQPGIGSMNPSIIEHVIVRFNFSIARSKLLNRKLQFKTMNSRESFRLSTSYRTIHATSRQICLHPLGAVKARLSRLPEGDILNVTIIKTRSGRYYASVMTRQPDLPISLETEDNASAVKPLVCIGLDMGINHFLTQSDGRVIENPRYFKGTMQRIAHLQRSLKRKSKDSSNFKKQSTKVARLHEQHSNQRHGFLHRLSSRIIRENDIIAIESLAIRDLLMQKTLSLQINDAAWRKFISMLIYKAMWYGKTIVQVDRYFPSSKICCKCHWQMPKMTLSVREWTCPKCGVQHDRDTNAAINILREGARLYLNKHPGDRQRLTPVLSERR